MSLTDLSDTKLLFRYIQAAHHKGHVSTTPKGLLKMKAKLDGWVKLAAPNPKSTKRVSEINDSWAQNLARAMRTHYEELMNDARVNIEGRQFTQESFDHAWTGAQKWGRASLGKKLAIGTIESARDSCRSAALNQEFAARPRPNSPLAPAPAPTQTQPNDGWSFAKYNSNYSRPAEIRAVSGPYDPLSNFYAFPFWHRGILHKSMEHAYHMEKAQFLGNLQAWHAPDAHGAKDKSKQYFKSQSWKLHVCMIPGSLESRTSGME